MSHATPGEIHDHAYGFRRSEHVASCADCARGADAVSDEREGLRRMLEVAAPEAPADLLARCSTATPGRSRIAALTFVAAALLLSMLFWLLLQPHEQRVPQDPVAAPAPTQESEIDRLIGEFQSPSPVRQKIARLALKKYGAGAIDALLRAKADPRFIDEVRGISEADRAVLEKMKQTPITIEIEHALYTDVLERLEPLVGKAEVDLSGHELDSAFVTLRVSKGTVHDAIESLCAQLKVPFAVRHGSLRIGKQGIPPAAIPVRIMVRQGEAARHIPDLSSADPARRKAAAAALRDLGFAAEPALWAALDGSPEARDQAAQLLQDLYDPKSNPENSLTDFWKRQRRIDGDFEDKPLQEIASAVAAKADLCLVWDARIEPDGRHVTFKVKDLAVVNVLKLLLSQFQFDCQFVEDCAVIAAPGKTTAWTPSTHTMWLPGMAEAWAVEVLITDLGSSDPARSDKAARAFEAQDHLLALDVLAFAAGSLDGAGLARCHRLRRTIAEKHGIWIVDIPSGADVQMLTAAQKTLLDAVVLLPQGPKKLADILGLPCEFKAPFDVSLRVEHKGTKRSTLLKAILRPQGLDYYMDGDRVVIDTAANVRAAVEK